MKLYTILNIFTCKIILSIFLIIIVFLAINKIHIAGFDTPPTTTLPTTTLPTTTLPTTTLPTTTLPTTTLPTTTLPTTTLPTTTLPTTTLPTTTLPIPSKEMTKIDLERANSPVPSISITSIPTTKSNTIKPTPTFDSTYKAPNCIEKDNIVGVCNNYTNCCVNTNTCLCSNPLVRNCNSDYEKCISSNGIDCDSILKKCCNSINMLKIDATEFDNSFKNNQNEGMYCMVNTVSNPHINCMGICKYDDKCKAFSIDTMNNCMFFNKVELSSDKTNNLSNNYYIKKKNT